MYNYKLLDPELCDFVEVAAESDLPPTERLFVEIDGLPIVVFNIAGEYYAIGDVCSHDNGPLGDGEVEGLEVTCPRHGARFDLRTGQVRSLPAIVDIPAYPVRVVDSQIQVGVPKELA